MICDKYVLNPRSPHVWHPPIKRHFSPLWTFHFLCQTLQLTIIWCLVAAMSLIRLISSFRPQVNTEHIGARLRRCTHIITSGNAHIKANKIPEAIEWFAVNQIQCEGIQQNVLEAIFLCYTSSCLALIWVCDRFMSTVMKFVILVEGSQWYEFCIHPRLEGITTRNHLRLPQAKPGHFQLTFIFSGKDKAFKASNIWNLMLMSKYTCWKWSNIKLHMPRLSINYDK
jgi:hypothetical protein